MVAVLILVRHEKVVADSRVRFAVEEWIREVYLSQRFSQSFRKQEETLPSGQRREIDAISTDGNTYVEISTSTARTATGNPGTGAMRKIKNDVLDLFALPASRRIICVTEAGMGRWIEGQKRLKNFPGDLEVLVVELPRELRQSLNAAQREASAENTSQS